eukprot:CAMPEP_0194326394 /NCGR_PEP_ID=MMETSP0171-20130528/36343_1 /TAXON_ID=218684 /ORGANISM="Corethron pennatum, Strain L29A3" /LENGTH=340 /DNA_ID=CAMNT_0039085957 /DNA_START=83 /DNA_END=1105 /DNA_ORIENTATION=-
MDALREKRISEMGNPEKQYFTNICMDGFEDLLLNNISLSDEADDDDIHLNDGISDIHSGACCRNSTNDDDAESCLHEMLKCYFDLVEDVQRPGMKDAVTKRIHAVLGEEFDFDLNFKSFQGMMIKTFIRRKQLNDAVRTTIVCSAEEELAIREHISHGRMKKLRDNGLLSVKDDLFSKKEWPVLKLSIPGCSYLYEDEEARQREDWTRMVYGIEIQVTGPEFMELKESMHDEYEVIRIDTATRDFLNRRPFQMGNLEVIIAFLRAMDEKNGDGEQFLRISMILGMVKERKKLCDEEGIDLKVQVVLKANDKRVKKRIKNLKALAKEDENKYKGIFHFVNM